MIVDGFKFLGTRLKRLFESPAKKELRASRKDLHENRNEMQRSIATARQSGKKSSAALRVAENALKMLERNKDGIKQ